MSKKIEHIFGHIVTTVKSLLLCCASLEGLDWAESAASEGFTVHSTEQTYFSGARASTLDLYKYIVKA